MASDHFSDVYKKVAWSCNSQIATASNHGHPRSSLTRRFPRHAGGHQDGIRRLELFPHLFFSWERMRVSALSNSFAYCGID